LLHKNSLTFSGSFYIHALFPVHYEIPGVTIIGFLGEEYKLTIWSRALLEKPPVVQLFKNFLTFYGT
jgi:hypothetical protein